MSAARGKAPRKPCHYQNRMDLLRRDGSGQGMYRPSCTMPKAGRNRGEREEQLGCGFQGRKGWRARSPVGDGGLDGGPERGRRRNSAGLTPQ